MSDDEYTRSHLGKYAMAGNELDKVRRQLMDIAASVHDESSPMAVKEAEVSVLRACDIVSSASKQFSDIVAENLFKGE